MKITHKLSNLGTIHLYFLFIAAGTVADIVMTGKFDISLYGDGYRQILTEAFVFGLVFTLLIAVPNRLRLRAAAWDAIYDFKTGADAYSQGQVRCAFRDLLSTGVKTFTFYAPKGSKRDFSNFRIVSKKFKNCRFISVLFQRAKFFSVTFKDTAFKNVQFTGSTLHHVTFKNCRFIGCDFTKIKSKHVRTIACEFVDCIGSLSQ